MSSSGRASQGNSGSGQDRLTSFVRSKLPAAQTYGPQLAKVRKKSKYVVATERLSPVQGSRVYDPKTMSSLTLTGNETDLQLQYAKFQTAMIQEAERVSAAHDQKLEETNKLRERMDSFKGSWNTGDSLWASYCQNEHERQKIIDYAQELFKLNSDTHRAVQTSWNRSKEQSGLTDIVAAEKRGTELSDAECAVIWSSQIKSQYPGEGLMVKMQYIIALTDLPDAHRKNALGQWELPSEINRNGRISVIRSAIANEVTDEQEDQDIEQYLKTLSKEGVTVPTLSEIKNALPSRNERGSTATDAPPPAPWFNPDTVALIAVHNEEKDVPMVEAQWERQSYGKETSYPPIPISSGQLPINRENARASSFDKPPWAAGPEWTEYPVADVLANEFSKWANEIASALDVIEDRYVETVINMASGLILKYECSILDGLKRGMLQRKLWKTLAKALPGESDKMWSAMQSKWEGEARWMEESIEDDRLEEADKILLRKWLEVAKQSTDPKPFLNFVKDVVGQLTSESTSEDKRAERASNLLLSEEARKDALDRSKEARENAWPLFRDHGFDEEPTTFKMALDGLVKWRELKRAEEKAAKETAKTEAESQKPVRESNKTESDEEVVPQVDDSEGWTIQTTKQRPERRPPSKQSRQSGKSKRRRRGCPEATSSAGGGSTYKPQTRRSQKTASQETPSRTDNRGGRTWASVAGGKGKQAGSVVPPPEPPLPGPSGSLELPFRDFPSNDEPELPTEILDDGDSVQEASTPLEEEQSVQSEEAVKLKDSQVPSESGAPVESEAGPSDTESTIAASEGGSASFGPESQASEEYPSNIYTGDHSSGRDTPRPSGEPPQAKDLAAMSNVSQEWTQRLTQDPPQYYHRDYTHHSHPQFSHYVSQGAPQGSQFSVMPQQAAYYPVYSLVPVGYAPSPAPPFFPPPSFPPPLFPPPYSPPGPPVPMLHDMGGWGPPFMPPHQQFGEGYPPSPHVGYPPGSFEHSNASYAQHPPYHSQGHVPVDHPQYGDTEPVTEEASQQWSVASHLDEVEAAEVPSSTIGAKIQRSASA